MIFLFFSSSLAHLEPELELFEVWEINVRQIMIIANFKQNLIYVVFFMDTVNPALQFIGSLFNQ